MFNKPNGAAEKQTSIIEHLTPIHRLDRETAEAMMF